MRLLHGGAVERRRAVQGAVCLLAGVLAGCGDGAPEPAPPGPPAEDLAREDGAAAVSTVALARELRELGLPAVALPGPGVSAALAAFGPAPALVAESPRAVDRSSPSALLGSALAAIAAEDLAALARLGSREALDEDALARAERRFLGPATRRYWERIERALEAGAYRVEPAGEDAVWIVVEVGGAAGAYRLRLQREEDGWYLVG